MAAALLALVAALVSAVVFYAVERRGVFVISTTAERSKWIQSR